MLKIFLIVGLILKYCLQAKADPDCTETIKGLTKIEEKINNFRANHDLKKIKLDQTTESNDSIATMIKESTITITGEGGNKQIVYKQAATVKNDENALLDIIDEWINSGSNYDYKSKISDVAMKPFVLLLWDDTEKVECALCVSSPGEATDAFGCEISKTKGDPYPTIPSSNADVYIAHLKPPKNKNTTDQTVKPGPNEDENSKDQAKEDKHPSSLENTIRTWVLVTFILVAVVVALTCGVALLVAAKVFVQ